VTIDAKNMDPANASDPIVTNTVTFTVADAANEISANAPATYSQTEGDSLHIGVAGLFASDDPMAFTVDPSSSLPAGLSLDANGNIVGTITAEVGTYAVTIDAKNMDPANASDPIVTNTVTFTVADAANEISANAPATYSQTEGDSLHIGVAGLFASDDSMAFTVDPSSSLPAGLSLDANGNIVGTITAEAGTYAVTIDAKNMDPANASDPIVTNTVTFTVADATNEISLNPAPAALSAQEYTSTSSLFDASTLFSADDPMTYAVDPSHPLPSGLTIDPNTGIISGTPTQSGGFTVDIIAQNMDPNNLGEQIISNSFRIVVSPFYYSDVSGGGESSLALGSFGNVYAWGSNGGGEFGNNTTTGSPTPVEAHGVGDIGFLSDITAISEGSSTSLALDASGNVYAMGFNGNGQLGNNTTTDSHTPIEVLGVGGIGFLSNIIDISEGQASSLALSASGNVYAWGLNSHGELGINTTIQSNTPAEVQGVGGSGFLSNIIDVQQGDLMSLALSASGNVYAWGSNTFGDLGNNSTAESNTPVEVQGVNGIGFLSHIIGISVSEGALFSLALSASGNVYAWGLNNAGQLGINTASTDSLTPVEVHGVGNVGVLSNIVEISAGGATALALSASGNVYAWGYNGNGQLGNNSITDSHVPVEVQGVGGTGFLTNIIAISEGGNANSFALSASGNVYAWGENNQGGLGNGTTIDAHTPVLISGNTVSNGINQVNVVTEPGPTGLPEAGGIGLAGANNVSIQDILDFNTPANDYLVLRLDNPTFTAVTGSNFGATTTAAQLDAYNATNHFATFTNMGHNTIITFAGGGDITLTGVNYHQFEDFQPDHLILSHMTGAL
ncbi:MAG: putative Ig domain-containing protein, partial [Bacillota bacterium]|nr:putative Ig domain-containing protein [Bacillota bacterium]